MTDLAIWAGDGVGQIGQLVLSIGAIYGGSGMGGDRWIICRSQLKIAGIVV
jgi:hypothetical protein